MYIADDNIEAADRMLARIEHQAELLRGHPFMGRIGRVPRTREMPVPQTPFLLVYRVSARAVRIGRVLHHARQYP